MPGHCEVTGCHLTYIVHFLKTRIFSRNGLFFKLLQLMENLFICYPGEKMLKLKGRKKNKKVTHEICKYVDLPVIEELA